VKDVLVEVLGRRLEHARAQDLDRAVDEKALAAMDEIERTRLF